MATLEADASHLPEAVLHLAMLAGCRAEAPPREIRLRQAGQMRQDRASAWMSFRARQRIAVDRCAFEWNARTGPMGLVHVRDRFEDGRGALSVALLGVVPVARVRPSAGLDRGELMRYLAELPWAPDAILGNPELRWRTTDGTRLAVSAGDGDGRAEITFTLDTDGRIAEAFAPDRPRTVGDRLVPGAWRGVFSDYRRCGDRFIPMSAEVGWEDGGDFECVWRGEILDWRAV